VRKAAGNRLITFELLRGIDQDVHRNTHAPEQPAHLSVSLGARQVRFVNDQEIDIAVGITVIPSPRTKEDDLLRIYRVRNFGRDDLKQLFVLGNWFDHNNVIVARLTGENKIAWNPCVANSRRFEDVVGKHIASAAATLPPEIFAAAQERGRARDPWATVEELLEELNA
jgi:hypothetical protein